MVEAYLRPRTVDEALAHLDSGPGVLVAGCTDYYPNLIDRPPAGRIIDLSGIDEARGIAADRDTIRFGALTTWTDVVNADLPAAFDGLREAAARIGAVQVQNVATVGGNLCNASPAADGVPPLLTLDASVELRSAAATRTLPLGRFIAGNRRTRLEPGEMMTAVVVPRPGAAAAGAFLKLGGRHRMAISITMAAALIEAGDDRRIAVARIAVGACSEVAQRLPELERALTGRRLAADLGDLAEPGHLSPLSPIDDHRGTAAYRLDAALTLVRRLIERLAGGA